MDRLFWFFLPPFAGALIGLFTNWLAIKMLFRPRYEKRIFGVRIPFTPGILPRERSRLAASLGDTAASDLLTEDVLSSRILSDEFREAVSKAVYDGEQAFFSSSLKKASADVHGVIPALLRETLHTSVQSLSQSEAFQYAAGQAIQSALAEFDAVPLSALINRQTMAPLAGALLSEASCQKLATALATALDTQLQLAVQAGRRPADFIKRESLVELLDRLFSALWPLISGKLLEALRQQRIKQSMERAGIVLVRRIIERLNSMQRFLVGLGGYERSITESMPDIIDDFILTVEKLLERPEIRGQLNDWLRQQVLALLETPLQDQPILTDEAKRLPWLRKTEELLCSLLRSLDSARLAEKVAEYAEQQQHGSFFASFPALKASLAASASAWLSSLFLPHSGGAQTVSKVVQCFGEAFLDYAEEQTLGTILAVDETRMGELAEAGASLLATLAASQTSRIIQSVDIRTMVQDRINDLSIEQVERMILRVMDRELKAVTWFGALLGGLMGLAQALLNLLR